LCKGVAKDALAGFKRLRRTKRTHDHVDDVMGSAEASPTIQEQWGVKMRLM